MDTDPNNINSQYLSSWPQQAQEMAQIAYELTSEKWPLTGQGSFHPTIENGHEYNDIVEEIANRIVAVLTIRLVALLTCRLGNRCCGQQSKIYSDYSTTTICKAVLTHHAKQLAATPDWESYHPSHVGCHGNGNDVTISPEIPGPPFPAVLDIEIIQQLHTYTLSICKGYHSSDDVPYHNVEHAYHVFLSANKLLDLMLCEVDDGGTEPVMGQIKKRRTTYGIKFDPLAQLAFLFSALIHDVDHTGINNRQLVLESDDLAVLYNDQSVAEQNSLAVAFTTLKEPQYAELREVMFKSLHNNTNTDTRPVLPNSDDFFRFRKLVIDLVLATDIASPERTQIVKSKWKEAFGEAQVHISEEKKKDTAEKNNIKNVNFEPEVILKEQQKISGDSHRSLSESMGSVNSALSAETYLSDSGSSGISTKEDDDFNISSASSKKMNFDENDNGSGSAKSNKSDVSGSRPRRSLSSSATIPKSRQNVPARSAGFSRSMLSTSRELKNYRHVNNRRLGVRRALDLAGSTIEAVSSLRIREDLNIDDLEDDADEFKATACLEQMLRGADVSALMQDFENVRKWSTKLYKELNNGFCANRGEDPKIGWFDNQIKFFDFYILPLAKNLRVMVRLFFHKLYVISIFVFLSYPS